MQPNILTVLADNPQLFEAVKAVILKQFAEEAFDDSMPNEHIGELTRANWSGKKKVEAAFKEIDGHKTTAKQPEPINMAR